MQRERGVERCRPAYFAWSPRIVEQPNVEFTAFARQDRSETVHGEVHCGPCRTLDTLGELSQVSGVERAQSFERRRRQTATPSGEEPSVARRTVEIDEEAGLSTYEQWSPAFLREASRERERTEVEATVASEGFSSLATHEGVSVASGYASRCVLAGEDQGQNGWPERRQSQRVA